MRKNRVGIILFSLIFALAVFALSGKCQVKAGGRVIAYGYCGDENGGANATWTLDEDGIFRVSGTGRMRDHSDELCGYSQDSIKSILIDEGITYVGAYSFSECSNVTYVAFYGPETEIGSYAFRDCTGLERVRVWGNGSVKIVGDGAFFGCRSLDDIWIGDDLVEIGYSAFRECDALESFVIPESLEKIGDYAFSDCENFRGGIPYGVKSLGSYAFRGCPNFNDGYLPDTITKLGEGTFVCSGLTSIRIPDGVTAIPDYCFGYCEELESVTIPSGVKTIGNSAFMGCSVLSSITLPDGLEYLGASVFERCEKLSKIELPSKITSIPNYAFSESGIENITCKGVVTSIGREAFMECNDMVSFSIPAGVETIGNSAFSSCDDLKSITIPDSVTRIGSDVFGNCKSLSDIFCYAQPDELTWSEENRSWPGLNVPGGTICHVKEVWGDTYQTKFENLTYITFVGDLVELSLGEHLAGYSLSLEGDIGVNFYMFLDDTVAASDTAKMVFTIKSVDERNVRTQEVSVASPSKVITLGGKNCYVYKCQVNAKEMTSTIIAQVIDGEAAGQEYEYSVALYAKHILDNPVNYSNEQATVKSMLKYGAAAQRYFRYNLDLIADSFLAQEDREIVIPSASIMSLYAYTGNAQINDEISFYKVNLVMESEITMNLQFTGASENTVFKVGDKTLSSEKSGNITTVPIANIPISAVNDYFEISAYEGETCLGSVTYCPMTYCYNVINRDLNEVRTQELKNLVGALYYFSCSAEEYYLYA